MKPEDIAALNELIKPRVTTLSDGRRILCRPWRNTDMCRKCAIHHDCGDVGCTSNSGDTFFFEVIENA